jgi:hypothetical protein
MRTLPTVLIPNILVGTAIEKVTAVILAIEACYVVVRLARRNP